MALRLQRRVTLFPGVTLNFSKAGISTTLGVPGACLNVGAKGVTATLGLPGTGLSYRHKIGSDAAPSSVGREIIPQQVIEDCKPMQGIESASVEKITSPGMESFKRLIETVESRREFLQREIAAEEDIRVLTDGQIQKASHWFWGIFRKRDLPGLIAELETSESKLEDRRKEFDGSYIDLDVQLPAAAMPAQDKMVQTFKDLSQKCQRIWDVISDQDVEKKERSSASRTVSRDTVNFSLNPPTDSDTLVTGQPTLVLGNANGPDLCIYPGFIILRNRTNLALIGIDQLEVGYSVQRFIEDEEVPGDAEVVDQVWFKTNKNGSRDKRFKDNYQIPVVIYGKLTLRSPEGLQEEYSFSNYDLGFAFARALLALGDVLREKEDEE